MTYLVIERFHTGQRTAIYQRLHAQGRMLPAGVTYINSWLDEKTDTCYQIMESDSPQLLKDWIGHWEDLADFEIIPVISSQEASNQVKG